MKRLILRFLLRRYGRRMAGRAGFRLSPEMERVAERVLHGRRIKRRRWWG